MRTLPVLVVTVSILLTGPANALAGAGTTYILKVKGLACPFCAYGIERHLAAIDSVATAETDLKSGTVTLTTKHGARLDAAAVKNAVRDAGFTFQSLRERTPATSE